MSKNKEKQITNLQMVEIDHNAFAVEVKDGNIRFNLTQMARRFGTNPGQWSRIDEAKRYLEVLSIMQKCTTSDLLEVKQGGAPQEQGTWANHYLVAMEFARWLDPVFSVKVNELAWKILTKQMAVVHTRLRPELAIPDDLPGVPREHIFTSDFVVIDNRPVRRVEINKKYYYCLVDIQRSAGMGEYRSQLERELYSIYSFKIRTKENGKLARYLDAEGVKVLLSRSNLASARRFLTEFLLFVSPFSLMVEDYKKFDYKKFLEIIIKTQDENDRLFLFELYKTLGGVL